MSSRATITFTSHLKPTDYLKISFLLLFHGWRVYFIMTLFGVGLLLFIAGVNVIPLLFVAFFLALYAFIMIIKATSKNNRRFYLPCVYSFSEQGITGKTQISNETVPWQDILEWKRTGSYYLIYFTREKFLAIHQRDLQAAGIDNFDEILSRYLNKQVSNG